MATELKEVEMSTNCPHCGNPVELTKTETEEPPLQVGDLVVCKTVEEMPKALRHNRSDVEMQETLQKNFGMWARKVGAIRDGCVGFDQGPPCYFFARFKCWRP